MSNNIFRWSERVSDYVRETQDYTWKTEEYYVTEREPYETTKTTYRTCGYTTQLAKDRGAVFCESWDSPRSASQLRGLYPYGVTVSNAPVSESIINYRDKRVKKTRRVKDYYSVYRTTYASSYFTVELPIEWKIYQVTPANTDTVVENYNSSPSRTDPSKQIVSMTVYAKNRPPASSRSRITSKTYNLEVNIAYKTSSAPNAPGAIVLPPTRAFGYMANVLVKWGASTDPDGDLRGYRLEARYGTGAWELVDEKSSLNFLSANVQLPKGADQVEFRVQAFDAEGNRSGWTVSRTQSIEQNAIPRIWVDFSEAYLGKKNEPFSFNFYVDDDNENDVLNTTLRVNGRIAKTNSNVPRNTAILAEIENNVFALLPPNVDIPIEVTVEDQRNNKAFLNLTFQKENLAPIITVEGDKTDLGEVESFPNLLVTVTDPDKRVGDPGKMKISWSLDGVEKVNFETDKDKYSFNLDLDRMEWLKMRPGQNRSILVEVEDSYGEKAVKRLTFTRVVNRLEIKGKFVSSALDDVIKTVYVSMLWYVARGAKPTVRLCNNALDANPTWEDCTQRILDKVDIQLVNNRKTASDWAIGVWITIEKADSSDLSWVGSVGGAIK